MQDFFKENNIKGIIFDCDGVLVDSEKFSCGALNIIFEKYFNVDIGTDYSPVVGKSLPDGFAYYISKHNLILPKDVDMETLYLEKDSAYKKLARNNIKPFPGVVKLLKYLEHTTLQKSVASSGTIDKINFNLEQGNLLKYFTIISSSQEVMKGKPSPDLFLLSAKKMLLDPQFCVVIEDSILGIKGAKSANMIAIGVTTSFTEKELKQAGANTVINGLEELIPF